MKLIQRAFVLVVLATIGAVSAFADTMPKSLAETYARLDKVISSMDFKGFSSVFDANYTSVDPMGKVTGRKEFLGMLEQAFKMSTKAKQTVQFTNVTVSGDYVEVGYALKGEFITKQGPVKVVESGTDSWQLKDGKWMLYRTVQNKFWMTGM